MKVYYNSKIAKVVTFLADFATVMLFGAVFTEEKKLSERDKFHEASHVEQYETLFGSGLALAVGIMFTCFAFDCYGWWMLALIFIPLLLYYAWYLIEFVVRFIITLAKQKGWKEAHDKAYHAIVFEREAYDLENEYRKPCQERRYASSFSFLKYY
ncbi:hypothetical protein [Parabacteroides sp. AM08-6]|uniref:hypothetical protein n=1 Tax=Parabacteroides sp. AM08-6 TaxID=2292053 RepID=UPI000EFF3D18|nr:hypothetical protein [Parabacteroides sp. AM08-6]RHJ83014.1 hypothetical protein DW103_08735 [Parabacteroides sp. AM08-6]